MGFSLQEQWVRCLEHPGWRRGHSFHRFMRLLPLCTFLALLPFASAASAQEDLEPAVSAVVRIISPGREGKAEQRGSGFVVGLDRDRATIVTASHVIEGTPTQQIEVTFAVDLGQTFHAGALLGQEAGNERGLAVFQVRGALPKGVTALSFDTAVQLQRGEDLFLVGFPQMANSPLTFRRSYAGPSGNFLQLDQSVGEGFSGAPVLRKGKVVGVVMETDTQLTFAVNSLVAQAALRGWGVQVAGTNQPQAEKSATKCVPGEERIKNGIPYIHICGGTFTMGSAANDPRAAEDEEPAHEVTLSEFWLGKTEVSNAQYRRFHPDHKGEDNLPATWVSWDEAKAACAFFGGRLPTEAEWEYAARAGSSSAWSFGNDEEQLGEYAWYGVNSDSKPQAVGTRKPNPWNLSDMYGNVWEWVSDWYGKYTSFAKTDPTGPTTGEARVLRGGSFNYAKPRFLRSANRKSYPPSTQNQIVGFRCCR
jgi:formylglycine-generating enzyme required for sulfatase activity